MSTISDHIPETETAPKRDLRRYGWWLLALLILIAPMILSRLDEAVPSADINDFTTFFLSLFIEVFPFLLLGVFASGLIQAFVPARVFSRLPRNHLIHAIAGLLLGFVLPVGEAGVVPVTRRLFGKGASIALTITFLLAGTVFNPMAFVSTWLAFGDRLFFVLRFVISGGIAVGIGLLFAYAGTRDVIIRDARIDDTALALTYVSRLRAALRIATDELIEFGRLFIIGAILAAALSVIFRAEEVAPTASGVVRSVPVMQWLALNSGMNSTLDSFTALDFVNRMPGGSIVAYLVFGALLDVKTVVMLLLVLKPRALIYLLILAFLLTMLPALWLNLNVAF
ncbi:MAG: hypothetical protein D6737_11900 [Chloroflexi bacterium]|nr:MAG: hypothetical protein D6737_11900 [Chloroflexota bacterium]